MILQQQLEVAVGDHGVRVAQGDQPPVVFEHRAEVADLGGRVDLGVVGVDG